MKNKLIAITLVLGFLLVFLLTGKAFPKEEKLKVPSPATIRDFEPQPNRLMAVTYANDRIFLFQIEKIIPRSDCNQVRVDMKNRIRLITQAVSQAYEYILEPIPVMVSKWVQYKY